VVTKLVRLGDLARADPDITQCQARGCAPGQVVWLVLVKGDLGLSEGGPARRSVPLSWRLLVLNASTGASRGDFEEGPGDPPSSFDRLTDLARAGSGQT
jgi:hypothetical protein